MFEIMRLGLVNQLQRYKKNRLSKVVLKKYFSINYF